MLAEEQAMVSDVRTNVQAVRTRGKMRLEQRLDYFQFDVFESAMDANLITTYVAEDRGNASVPGKIMAMGA